MNTHQEAKIPHSSWPKKKKKKSKHKKRNNIVRKAIKTFKMVHIKKKKS